MLSIFDRETRREKMLYTTKVQAAKQRPAEGKKISKEKIAQQLDNQILQIEETFFKSVAGGDESEIEAIKAKAAEAGE